MMNIMMANFAISCPYLNGTAVYKARSINNYFHPEQVYNDWSLCAALYANKGTGDLYAMLWNENTGVSSSTAFGIFPNPASTEFTLTYDLPHKSNAVLSITDITGRVRKIIDIDYNRSGMLIPVSDLEPGVYTVSVADNMVAKYHAKLIIQ